MKQLPSILFFLGYLLGGWGVIWLQVMLLERGDPKFTEAVVFYYGLWIVLYLPIAIAGTIAVARMAGEVSGRLVAALLSLLAVLVAMSGSFYLDVHWAVILLEYLGFAVGFWFLARATSNTEHAP